MPQLIGTAPNQVPTNGDLGTAAYMDTSAFYGTGVSASFRNKIINGAMTIDQRNAGSAVTLTNQGYGLDRWTTWFSQVNKYTVQQNAGGQSPPQGHTFYQGVTSSSAYSLGASDYFGIGQKIEGYNINDLNWGTANASPVTISFWIRGSLPGTYSLVLRNGDGSYYYATTYTINTANTWEQKVLTIPGVTAGTWQTSNGAGIFLMFGLGTGANQTATANNTWINGGTLGAIGCVSLVGTSGAVWLIAGVQLEKGTVATPFEYRSYGTELQLCQRYFWKTWDGGATPSGWGSAGQLMSGSGMQGAGLSTGMINATFTMPVEMRAAPTAAFWDHEGNVGKTSSFNPNSANYSNESGSVATSRKTYFITRVSGSSASQIGAFVQLTAEI